MVSMLTPVRRDNSPIEKVACGSIERIEIPLDPVAATGCRTNAMTDQAENRITLAQAEARRVGEERSQRLLTLGAILGALAASTCCVVPLVLFGLGISGAWIANVTQLAPYQPYFLVVTAACLGGGYWLVYRSAKPACAQGGDSPRPWPDPVVQNSRGSAPS